MKIISIINRLIFFASLCLSYSQITTAQELPVSQLYNWNPVLINPAVTGSEECTYFRIIDRHQWIGIKNAPGTQILSAEKRILQGKTRWHGLGTILSHDINGAHRQLSGNLDYAFHFILSKKKDINLGFGLRGSVSQNTIDESDFTPVFDPAVTGSRISDMHFNASSGVYIYSNTFRSGFSVLQLFPQELSANGYSQDRYYFFTTVMHLNHSSPQLHINPGFVVKTRNLESYQLDINSELVFTDRFWSIFSYKHHIDEFPGNPNSLKIMLGLNLGSIGLGYAVDIGLTSIQKHHFGSHEFMLSYRICPPAFPCPVFQ